MALARRPLSLSREDVAEVAAAAGTHELRSVGAIVLRLGHDRALVRGRVRGRVGGRVPSPEANGVLGLGGDRALVAESK